MAIVGVASAAGAPFEYSAAGPETLALYGLPARLHILGIDARWHQTVRPAPHAADRFPGWHR